MRKLCLFMTACFLFSASANADIICVKNKVATNGNLVLNGKIRVVKKDSCPKGFSKLLSTDEFKGEKGEKGEDGNAAFSKNVLPAGTTVTGYVKTVSLEEAQILVPPADAFRVPVPVSLPMPSTVAIDADSIGTEKECTGSVTNPTAPAGKVCLYSIHGKAEVSPISLGNKYDKEPCPFTSICPECLYCTCSCVDESGKVIGDLGSSRQSFNVIGDDEPFEGIWAYTVPEVE